MNVYTRYTCKWQIFGNVRNCHLLPIIFTLDLPSYLMVTVSTSEKEECEHLVNTESRPLDVVAIYAPKTDPHLAIKILLHARKKILGPAKRLVSDNEKCFCLQRHRNVKISSAIYLLTLTIYEQDFPQWRGCAAIDQIQTGHSISIGQFNSECADG